MIHELRRYTSTKHSGLSWLDEIPSHWDVRRNGRLFAQRNQTGYPELPILEVSLKTGVRVRDFDNSTRKQVMSDRDKYKRAESGDIAYNMMRMWQGAVGVVPEDGLVSPAYVVARPYPETDSRYFNYLFRTGAYMGEVDNCSHGIVKDRNRLYWDDFKQIPSVFPPPDEQASIVCFLDHFGRRINRLIRAKQKLIKLLEEQKQAIIHRAVTRGLDPNVRLKHSGVEWLGEVPEHWEVKKLKWLASFNPSRAGAAKDLLPDDEVAFLPMERVGTDGQIDTSESRRVSEVWQGFSYFRRHDVVLAKITPCFENGKGAYLGDLPTTHGFGTTEFIVLRARKQVDPEHLYLITTLQKLRTLGAENMTGAAGQQRVSTDFLRHFMVPVPPVNEQRSILLALSAATEEIQKVLTRTSREIALVREYRTRLIADVVTGKLDVREAAARLPAEEFGELEEGEGMAENEEVEGAAEEESADG
ncbi:MAG: restriction endonuclease subunit S [Deferrisomatales bacterium]|nr:restriction endonuclease subunit S [Deferrisomatales bacterium]